MNPCNGCTKCCNGPLPLSETDYQAIPSDRRFYAVPISGIEAKYSYLLSEPTKYIIDTPTDSPCPYLSNNECSIYANRPEICRIFPAPLHYNSPVMNEWLRGNCTLYVPTP